MLVFRHLIPISAGIVIALGYGVSANAQKLTSLAESKSEQNSSNLRPTASATSLARDSATLGRSTYVLLAAQSKNSIPPVDDPTDIASILSAGQSFQKDTLNELFNSQPRVVDIAQVIDGESAPETREVTQFTPSEEFKTDPNIKGPPAPENANPSANPLLFPTKPSEVDVDNVLPVTLEQAIELALRNNKPFQAARLTLERSRAELNEALADRWPTLDANFDLDRRDSSSIRRSNARFIQRSRDDIRRTNRTRREAGLAELTEEERELFLDTDNLSRTESTNATGSLNLNYDVYTGGRRSANIQRARRQVRFSELDVERLAEETRFNATRNYYGLQNADAQVAIEQAGVEDTTQTLRDARLLEQAGLGTRFDVLRGEVDLADAEQELTSAIAGQRRARRQLAQTLSLGQQVTLTAKEEIQEAGSWPLSLEESIVQAYKNRAELEQQLVQREISEQQREIELATIRPQVSLFFTYDFLDDFDDIVGVEDGYIVGARVRWRLFDGGRALAAADRENRNIDLAETNFADQRNQIRLQVETAYFNLISNEENIGTTRQNVIRDTEALRLARLRFQAGVGTQTDVIDSQRNLTESRSSFLQAIIAYNQSLNELQRAISNLPGNRLFELR